MRAERNDQTLSANLGSARKERSYESYETLPEKTQDPPQKKPVKLETLDIELLALLGRKAMNGYQLKKDLERSFDANVSYGTLYPHLKSLDEIGLIKGKWTTSDEGKNHKATCVFNLTDKGRGTLGENLRRLLKITSLIQDSLQQTQKA